MIKKLLLFMVLIFLGERVCAQNEKVIEGRVTSVGDGGVLAGVNVVVKGTTFGASTNADGKYAINVHEDDVLVFSFIGYATVEFAVNGLIQLDVKLPEDISTLKEVTIVSTGYEQLPKERSTGSFVNIDKALINRRVSTDIISRLEDVTSGMIFNRNVAGKANDISIRGTSTIFSNTAPLIVIDNFPYDGDLTTVNPNDVESITVLKDAAAASIWGARAGNGVIVITTKKGKRNEMKATVNANTTFVDKPDLFYAPQMSSVDFVDVEKMLFDKGYYANAEASNQHAPLTPAVELMISARDGLLSADDLNKKLDVLKQQDVRRDFEKYLYRTGIKQQYAVNINGGGNTNRYYVSAGWDKNLDNLVGNGYNRVTFNVNNTWTAFKERLEFSSGIYYSENTTTTNNGGPSTIRFNTISPMYPYARLRDDAGNNLAVTKDYRDNFVEQSEGAGLLDWMYKPLDELKYRSNKNNLTDYRINAKLNYKLGKGLKAEVLYQYWRGITDQNDLRDKRSYYARNLINQYTQDDGSGALSYVIPVGGILDILSQTAYSNNLRTVLTYSKNSDVHDLNALGGYEVRGVNTGGSSFRYYGYDDALATNGIVDYVSFFSHYDNPGSYAQIPNYDSRWGYVDRFVSWFGNASYSYRHRYIVSGSVRKDQSNLFGVKANQRGVPLWSAGVAWNLNDESFYHFDALPMLKLRATYGYNGNINKNVTAYTTATRVGYDYLNGLPYAVINNPPNNNLRWERVKILNIGVDFQLKNRVVAGSVEWYLKRGIDLIGTTPFAPSTGITQFTGNTANTKGQGVDIVLNSQNVNKGVMWTTNVLFTYLSEKVSRYKEEVDASAYMLYGAGSSGSAIPLEGKPLYALYSYAWAGLDPQTGDPRSLLDGQPSSDYANIITSATPSNIVYHGSARPLMFGSVRNTVTWKNLSLSFNISYRLKYYFRRNSVRYDNVLTGQLDHSDYALRWQQPGDELKTQVPAMPGMPDTNRDNVYLYSSALAERGDHIRLQDINLNYTMDKGFLKLPFERVQLYVYVNNLGILWKATKTGLDPDYNLVRPVRSVSVGVRIDL